MEKFKKISLLFIIIIFFLYFSCQFLFEEPFPTSLGKTWKKYEVPSYVTYNEIDYIQNIFVSDYGSTIYFFKKSHYNELYISENSGLNWEKCNISDLDPEDYAISSDVSIIYFIFYNHNDYKYYLAKSTDKGKTYNIINQINHVYKIACSSDGKNLLMVEYGIDSDYNEIDYLYISKDYGQTISKITYPFPFRISFVRISDDGSKIIVASNDKDYLYFSNDSGQNFRKLEELDKTYYTDASFSRDSSTIYITSTSNYIIYSNDGGNTFNYLDDLRISNWSSVSISYDKKVIYFTSSDGYIYRSLDYGVSWQPINISGSFSYIRCSSDGSKVFVLSIKENSPKSSIIGSNDFLNSYSTCILYNSVSKKYSYNFISEDGMEMVFFSPKKVIIKTEDGAKTWKNISQENFEDIKKVSASKNFELIALINNNTIYISKDKAESWVEENQTGKSDWKDISVSYDGTTIVAIDSYDAYISRDKGTNWEKVSFNSANLRRCWVSDYADVILIAEENSIFIANSKTNNFVKKNIVFNGLTSSNNFFYQDCHFSSDGKTIAIPSHSSFYTSIINFSTDSGATWKSEDIYAPIDIMALSKDGDILILAEECDYDSEFGPNYGFIHRFYNNFTNHEIFANFGFISCNSIAISDDKSLIFIDADDEIYVSLDQGKTFAKTDFNVSKSFSRSYFKINTMLFLTKDKKKLIKVTINSDGVYAIYISSSK